MDYRSRLYRAYVRTHFGHIRNLSQAALDRDVSSFHHYFGWHLPGDRDLRILDLGCGYGSFLHYLRKRGYRNAEGVDISQEQIDAAASLGLTNVTCTDGLSFLQERPETFDCIVAFDFLEHFEKAEVLDVLDVVNRSLKPSGTLILQSPNAGSPFWGRYRHGDFTHGLSLTSFSARQILGATGFDNVNVYGTDPYVHGLTSLIRVGLWKLIKIMLRGYIAIETGVTQDTIVTQNMIVVARKSTGRL